MYWPAALVILVLVVIGVLVHSYREEKRVKAKEAAERERWAFKQANPPGIYGDPEKHEKARTSLAKLEESLKDI
jgi:heme exporter protein D